MNKLVTTLAFALLAISVAACRSTSGTSAPPLTDDQNKAKTQLDAQMKEAAQTAQTYHAMDNPTLLNNLVEQSKAGKEPFNSLAYRELKTRTNVDSSALVTLVKQNDNAGGLLPLLLLRKLDNKSYLAVPAEARAKILTDALQSSKYFNTWGLPNAYLEDASNAMIEAGRAAAPALRKMLADTRPAPSFGSQEYMMYKHFNYRVCDYALFFLEKIEGNADFKMPASPPERDPLIKQEAAKK